MLNYDKFTISLQRLEEQFNYYKTMDDGAPDWMKKAIIDSVLYRFEISLLYLTKALKKHLTITLDVPNVPNTHVQIFRIADKKYVTRSMGNFIGYLQVKTDISRNFNDAETKFSLIKIGQYMPEAIELHEIITRKKWIKK